MPKPSRLRPSALIFDMDGLMIDSDAYQYGFYDQSHFIKEFKSFSGITPSQFLSKHAPIIG